MSEMTPDANRLAWTAAPVPTLRVVPDHPVPLGDGVLPAETPIEQEMVCRRVLRVTHDVVTVVLQPTRPVPLSFAPGQFVTLGLDVDGEWLERCYTISSPPTRPHLLTVTVKKVPGGPVSTWLNDRFRVGDRVSVSGPLGGFSVVEHPASRYLLLSAGSGITPTLSTLRTLVDLGERLDVVVVHSARTPDDIVCRAEVEAMCASQPGLSVHWLCESAPAATQWDAPLGRLGSDLLGSWVPDVAEREVLVCGPTGYMSAVDDVLDHLGTPAEQRHRESFVLGAAAAPVLPVEAAPEGDTGPTVRFGRSGREVVCAPGQTVLQAAEAAGVLLPSSCSEGLCGTCKQTLLAGRVEMHHQGGIRPREVAQDKFLPCCSTPDGDITVDA